MADLLLSLQAQSDSAPNSDQLQDLANALHDMLAAHDMHLDQLNAALHMPDQHLWMPLQAWDWDN